MLESAIERKVCAAALKLGVLNFKLDPARGGKAGYPDRLFFIPGGRPLMIEFKRPGETPTAIQLHIHTQLRLLKYKVEVHDNVELAIQAIKQAMEAG